jgi:hypothetical protein
LRPQVADAALGRSGDDDRSTAAGDGLPVDENILAIVDRDVVTVRVGVDASAAVIRPPAVRRPVSRPGALPGG